jgi:hypothetical protein
MEVYKFNNVFSHVEVMLRSKYSENPNFNNTLFVLGYNVLENLNFLRQQYPNYKIIVYQLEQLYNNSDWVNQKNYKILKSADEIWDYDESNIQWMQKNYRLTAKFHPILYTDQLKVMDSIDIVNPDIDILFYGYIQERRAKMFFHLQNRLGGRFKFINLYGIWGDELDSYINRSKIILNIHSHEQNKQEQVRMFYPVLNGRCVLSEKSTYNYLGDSIIEVPFNQMVEKSISLLQSGDWEKMALSCSETFKNISNNYIKQYNL